MLVFAHEVTTPQTALAWRGLILLFGCGGAIVLFIVVAIVIVLVAAKSRRREDQ